MSIPYGTSSQIMLPSSANNVIEYVKETLGEPIVQVNVTDSQILHRIGEALSFFKEYSDDATKREYLLHTLTQEDIDNNSFRVANNVFEVLRVIDSRVNNRSLFTSVNYNMRHELNFQEILPMVYSSPLTSFVLFNMKLEEIDELFNFERGIQFNTFDRMIKPRIPFKDYFHVGDNIVYECYTIIDPETNGSLFTDRKFLELVTALVKKQWGSNLIKFKGTPMFGGITFNAEMIYNEGVREIEEAKQDIINSGYPPMMIIG